MNYFIQTYYYSKIDPKNSSLDFLNQSNQNLYFNHQINLNFY